MKTWSKEEAKNAGLLALRIAIGIVFIRHGLLKLTGIEGVVGMVDGIGFPFPVFWAWALALVEFVGGIGILIGLYTRFMAKLLIIDMVFALLLVHTKAPFAAAELAISMLGILIAILFLGGGAWVVSKKDCTFKFCRD